MKVFFSGLRAAHASGNTPYIVGIIDEVSPVTNKGVYSGQTLERIREDYPDAVVLDSAEAMTRIEDSVIWAPHVITEDRFMDLLEVLPPCRWIRRHDSQSFHISERLTGTVVTWCVKVGDTYFELQDRSSRTHSELVEMCVKVLEGNK